MTLNLLILISASEEKSRLHDPSKPFEDSEANEANPERPGTSAADFNDQEASAPEVEVPDHGDGSGDCDVTTSDSETINQVESVKLRFVDRSENFNIPQLERLYTRIMKGIFEIKDTESRDDPKASILSFLVKFVEDDSNF